MNREEREIPLRTCASCKHNEVCKMFEAAIEIEREFNERFGKIVQFPTKPIQLAFTCKAYESPRAE